MNAKNFNWHSEQGERFQSHLNNSGKELDDDQLDEALQDFIDWEEDYEEKMTLDTFKERLKIRTE